MEIKGERIILTDFNEKDFSFYNDLETNSLTYQYSNAPETTEIQKHYQMLISSINKCGERYELAICTRIDEKPIGRISIKLNWAEIREWEIGYALHPNHWKQGFGVEAVNLIIEYAFNVLNAHRIVAYINTENLMSEKLMNRVGMVKDGTLREVRICNGKWCDESIYSMLEREWNERRIV